MRRHYALALIVALLSTAASGAEEIVDVATPRGALQPYLLSSEPEQQYAAVALLFTGGGGRVGLHTRIPQPGENFLVRSRALFVKNGVATAVIDVPSDRTALTDGFRLGSEHSEDIAAVVADVRKRFPEAKVFLVGTSRGTISAARIGAALGERVHGVVLTSTLFIAARAGPGLSSFDFATIRAPVLFVHHRDDACTFTPYSSAERLGERFALMSVAGGDTPRSGPCDPFHYHGYLGREEAVVGAISAWMLGRAFPRDIR